MAKQNHYSLGHLAYIAAQFNGNQSKTAEALGCHRDSVARALKLQRNGQLQGVQPTPLSGASVSGAKPAEDVPAQAYDVAKTGKDFQDKTENGNAGEIVFMSTRHRTLDEWIAALKIDTKKWAIEYAKPNSWQVAMKRDEGGALIVTVYQFKANLKRIRPIAVIPELKPVTFKIARWADLPKRKSTQIKRALIWGDMQVGYDRSLRDDSLLPFHDRTALDVMAQIAADLQPDLQVNVGDNMDNPEFSTKYQPKPEHHRTTQATVFELGWIYAQQRANAPKSEIHWIRGNHDERLLNYVISYMQAMWEIRPANEPDGAPLISLERLLGLDDLGIKLSTAYPHGRVTLADWVIHHGYVYGAGSGKTTAKVSHDTHHNQIQGHGHRNEVSYKTYQDLSGKPRTYCSAMIGTLAHVLPGRVPAASPRLNWQQGGGVLNYLEDASFSQFDLFGIHEGQAMVYGKRYLSRAEAAIVAQLESDTGYKFGAEKQCL